MKDNTIKKYVSLSLEFIVVICSIIGVILSILRNGDPYMGGPSTILYFTIQSNIWIAFILCLIFVCKIIGEIKNKNYLKNWMYIVKYIFTVSISLTGVVYCGLLAPVLPKEYNAWNLPSVLTHIIVPVCSIIDVIIDQFKFKINNKQTFLVLIPPLYYLVFAIIGYFAGFEYVNGENYPYFFLNFGCDAGLFGFIKDPIEIGCFYWMMLFLLVVLGLGFLYKFIINKVNKEIK